MLTTILIIVGVFGTILAIFLYKYLIQSSEYEAKKTTPTNMSNQITSDTAESIAKKVFELFEKVEEIELDLNNLHSYMSQKVEQSKKKQKVTA